MAVVSAHSPRVAARELTVRRLRSTLRCKPTLRLRLADGGHTLRRQAVETHSPRRIVDSPFRCPPPRATIAALGEAGERRSVMVRFPTWESASRCSTLLTRARRTVGLSVHTARSAVRRATQWRMAPSYASESVQRLTSATDCVQPQLYGRA